MAEPAVATPDLIPPSASVNDSLGIKEVTAKMADNQREKIAAEDKIIGGLDATIDKSLPKIEELSKKAGVEAEKLKPWDADAEAAKRRTDPIEAFGSFGSVFGILASAFTHAPMENALNASAAAMTAIKNSDQKSYDQAHKGWEDNMKLAMDRHKIQHDAYQDATSLLSTNMQAAQTKLSVLAARFGDKQVQTLLDAGMNKEVEEVLQARQRSALALQEQMPKIAEENAKISRLFALGYDTKNPQSEKSQEALKTFQKEQVDLKRQEHSYSTNPSKVLLDRYLVEKPDASAEDIAAFLQKNKVTGSARVPKPEEEAVRARAKELEDGGMTKAEAIEKAQHEYKLKTVAPSGNKIDDLKSRENKITNAETTINQIDEMLLKHKAITGLGGKITRTGEAVGNILGSNETDRAQFRRWVLELQETLPSVLNDRNGRPISSEAEKITGIVAGLATGDTNANTLRAYDELRPLLSTIKKQLQERRGESPAATPEPKSTRTPSWKDAPEVK